MPAERLTVEQVRARAFLTAQSTLLAIAILLVVGSNLTGQLAPLLVVQSYAFCGIAALLTGAGWWTFYKKRTSSRLVLALLYVDSILGLAFFYIAGEFETPAFGILYICIVMTPIFAGQGHAWRLAALQWVGYTLLILVRKYGGDSLAAVLPYGYMLPADAVNNPSFLLDSWTSFTISVGGMAYLAGRASIDIVNSQGQLEGEVAKKTRELAATSAALQLANDGLETANTDLASTNDALAETNRALGGVNEELRLSNARLQQFNHAVSHDLRAPLQAVIMRAEILAMTLDKDPVAAAELAENIADGAARMGELIEELLKLSRIDGQLNQVEPVHLEEVVELTRQDLASRIGEGGSTIDVRRPLPVASGNPSLIREVLQNLLDNAVKYGLSGGPHVLVEAAEAPDGWVAIAVEDNGEGIPPVDRAAVFGLFRRLAKHSGLVGMGAGLAIVQRIVEVHGGRIRIEDGRTLSGARFVVELPAG